MGRLTVLAAGLDELRDRPVVPPRFLEGLQDTLEAMAVLRAHGWPGAAFNDPLDECLEQLRRQCAGPSPTSAQARARTAVPDSRPGCHAGDLRRRGLSGFAVVGDGLPAAGSRGPPGSAALGLLAPHAAAQLPSPACRLRQDGSGAGGEGNEQLARLARPAGRGLHARRVAAGHGAGRGPHRPLVRDGLSGRRWQRRCRPAIPGHARGGRPGGRRSGPGGAAAVATDRRFVEPLPPVLQNGFPFPLSPAAKAAQHRVPGGRESLRRELL